MIRPTREQTWLLRACLLSGRDAADAWQSWRSHVSFDEIDAASYRLMPLLYQNLRREKIEGELLGRLKGIYRHTWSRNQLLFHAAARTMRAMTDAGIPVILLKGAALAGSFYTDAGLRPMNDFDFMVRLADAPRAFDVMKRCGWISAEPASLEQLVWCSYAGKWVNGSGQQIDLHWHLMPEGRQAGADDDVWTRAAKIEIGGQIFQTMNATDLLWHVCAHGGIGDEIAPIRWVADAWTLLQKNSAPDWEHLVAAVQHRGLTLPIGRALNYLREEFGAPVPLPVLQVLAATRVTWTERWAHRIKSRPPGMTGALPLHCVNYLRLTRDQSLTAKISGLPLFFRRAWGVSSAWRLPGCFYDRVMKRLARRRNSDKTA